MPAPAPPTNKGKKFPPEPLTTGELRRLVHAAPNRSTAGIRLRGLIAVLAGSGIRISEAMGLLPKDIDTDNCKIRVREGKGGKSRTVGIDQQSCAMLDRWMDHRATLGLTGRHHVFCTYSANNFGHQMSTRYARTILSRLGVRAGIEKRVHPHGMRHTLASAMVEEGVPLNVISAQFGHSSTSTTDDYLRKIAPAELIGRMQSRTPMAD